MADSAVFGRLAMPPVYDDVGYFVDGLLRLNVFRRLGMTGLVTDLWRHPLCFVAGAWRPARGLVA